MSPPSTLSQATNTSRGVFTPRTINDPLTQSGLYDFDQLHTSLLTSQQPTSHARATAYNDTAYTNDHALGSDWAYPDLNALDQVASQQNGVPGFQTYSAGITEQDHPSTGLKRGHAEDSPAGNKRSRVDVSQATNGVADPALYHDANYLDEFFTPKAKPQDVSTLEVADTLQFLPLDFLPPDADAANYP